MSEIEETTEKAKTARAKRKRRTKAQIEADRRLAALRKNLTKEIEADFDRFSGDSPSVAAGILVLARMRIILAFLQAFFPMFIKAPKPRKVGKTRVNKRGGTKKRTEGSATKSRKSRKARKPVVRVIKLAQEPDTSGPAGVDATTLPLPKSQKRARKSVPKGTEGSEAVV